MEYPKVAGRNLPRVAAMLAVLALGVTTPALAGHKYRDVLVVPAAAPIVYAAPTVYAATTVYAAPVVVQSAPIVVQSAPTVVIERTRIVESAPVVVQSAPVPTAYLVPRGRLRPLRQRVFVAEPVYAAPASQVVILRGW